jgi:hypothetical protein
MEGLSVSKASRRISVLLVAITIAASATNLLASPSEPGPRAPKGRDRSFIATIIRLLTPTTNDDQLVIPRP